MERPQKIATTKETKQKTGRLASLSPAARKSHSDGGSGGRRGHGGGRGGGGGGVANLLMTANQRAHSHRSTGGWLLDFSIRSEFN